MPVWTQGKWGGVQFFRNWMLGGDREAGSWGRDEIRNIEGSTANMPNKGSTGYVGGAFTIKGLGGGAAFNDGGSAYIQHLFNAANVVPTGPQNVPQHIWQPVIIYLGRPK